VEFLVELNITSTNSFAEQERLYHQTTEALNRRIRSLMGNSYPSFQPARSNRLRIVIPIPADAGLKASVEDCLTNAVSLEFRLVHDSTNSADVPMGYEILKSTRHAANSQTSETLIVQKEPAGGLNSAAVKRATLTKDSLGKVQILIEFSPEGTERFAELTRANVGRRLAIVLNGESCSAPMIQSPIENGSALVSGNFEMTEALNLAAMLSTPLPVPVVILEERPF
jgi:preprotein translocase subunit SecD